MDLYTRHNEVPILSSRQTTVTANYYNHVQLALKRLGKHIRFQIPKLKHLDLILQKDAWVVVDRALNDVPIIAWTSFQVDHRENLHEPIRCELRTWHMAAAMVRNRTLEAMEIMLGEALEDGASTAEQLLQFPPKQ